MTEAEEEPLKNIPFFPSNPVFMSIVWETIQSAEKIVDLGCGNGSVRIELGQHYPNAKLVGYEISPDRAGLCREKGIEVFEQDLWSADVSDADIVYGFLLFDLMPRVRDEIIPRMKSGSWFVSHCVQIPDLKADAERVNFFLYRKRDSDGK